MFPWAADVEMVAARNHDRVTNFDSDFDFGYRLVGPPGHRSPAAPGLGRRGGGATGGGAGGLASVRCAAGRAGCGVGMGDGAVVGRVPRNRLRGDRDSLVRGYATLGTVCGGGFSRGAADLVAVSGRARGCVRRLLSAFCAGVGGGPGEPGSSWVLGSALGRGGRGDTRRGAGGRGAAGALGTTAEEHPRTRCGRCGGGNRSHVRRLGCTGAMGTARRPNVAARRVVSGPDPSCRDQRSRGK